MWIFTIAPEWVIHTIFTVGLLGVVAGFVLGFIPLIRQYKLAIQVISLLIMSLGVYLEGGLADYKEWTAKVKELEAKAAVAEEQAKTKNVEIQEKVVTETKIVREKGKDIIKYVDREIVKNQEIVKYIESCPVPKEIIDLHNQAASLNKTEGEKK